MELAQWLDKRRGIVARAKVKEAGFTDTAIRRAVYAGELDVIRRRWLATPHADADLVVAARAGGRIACVSAARWRGWWMPEEVGSSLHLHFLPNAVAGDLPTETTRHWTVPLIPSAPHRLVESIEDTLAHIAVCQSSEAALTL